MEGRAVGVTLAVALCTAALWAAEKGSTAMALAWLVVLTVGAAAVGLRLLAILRGVTREVR
jgi:hypothetical protein